MYESIKFFHWTWTFFGIRIRIRLHWLKVCHLGSCWVGDVDPIGCPLLLVVARGGHVDVHPEPLPVVPEVLNDERVLILDEHLQHGQR